MKILVTGGAGYIGSAFVKEAVNKHEITVIDNLVKGEKSLVHKDAKFILCDVNDKDKLNRIFSKGKFDCVVHCAALKAVGESEEKPELYFENNVSGTINVLNMMKKHKVKKIIFSSTACVYKNKKSGIYNEKDELEAPNVYGKTKLICEELIKDYKRTSDIDYVIFRYFNVAGDVGLNYVDKNAQNIFPIIGDCLSGKRKKMQVFGNNYKTRDGSGVRDYIHLKDLIRAHILGLKLKKSDIFNLGTKKGTTVLELLQKFEKISKKKINYEIAARRKGDLPLTLANSSKAKKILKWEAKYSVDDMIKSTIKAYEK